MRIPGKKGKKKWDGFIPEIPGFGEAEERREWKGCSLVLGPKIEGYSKVWPQKWKDIPSFWPPKLKGYSLFFGDPNMSQKLKAIPNFLPQKLKDIPYFWPPK